MLLRRTPNRALNAWLSALLCTAAALASLACVASASAADAIKIELASVANGTGQIARQIGLNGSAPAHCAPVVERSTLDGADISVELQTPQTACDSRRTTPFHLRVDVARNAGLSALPGQVYRVRVYTGSDSMPALVAFRLLDTTIGAITPESGFWWSQIDNSAGPAAPGSGMSLEWQDGQLAVALFGFADSGAATWYFGSTRPNGHVAAVSLVQLANGDPLFSTFGAQPTAEAGPRLEIEFLSPTRARAWLVRSEDGRDVEVRQTILARSHFAVGASGTHWSGQWVLVPDDDGAPRMFDFAEPGSQDSESFHLADIGRGVSLDCRVPAVRRQPDMCTLSNAAGAIADFDQIGFDHLSGRDSNGAHVKLVRVPR